MREIKAKKSLSFCLLFFFFFFVDSFFCCYCCRTSQMILTHFEPIHARAAFPCFDEPGFKAKFQLTVLHKNDTQILGNWDIEVST